MTYELLGIYYDKHAHPLAVGHTGELKCRGHHFLPVFSTLYKKLHDKVVSASAFFREIDAAVDLAFGCAVELNFLFD